MFQGFHLSSPLSHLYHQSYHSTTDRSRTPRYGTRQGQQKGREYLGFSEEAWGSEAGGARIQNQLREAS